MKTIKLVLIVAIVSTLFISCKTNKHVSETHENVKTHKHWSYEGDEGPKNWSHIKEAFLACDGNSQSPININTTKAETTNKNKLVINYKNSTVDILNNGHTEEFVISKGNSLDLNGKEFELLQFHMHTLSEHTINGKHLPLEVHFVNKAADNTYAVISVLFEEGEQSKLLSEYLDDFPKNEGEYIDLKSSFKLDDFLPKNHKHFYHYRGSFTTPPCTEVVDWIVMKDKLTASKKQLETLHHLMRDNFRPIQKLNHRKITIN